MVHHVSLTFRKCCIKKSIHVYYIIILGLNVIFVYVCSSVLYNGPPWAPERHHYNNYNNTQIAAIALPPLTTHPQLWAELLTFKPKCTIA